MKGQTLFLADGSVLLVLDSGNSVEFSTVSEVVNYCRKYGINAEFEV